MKTFSGWEYLLIDLANQFGHDKLLFEQRIKWAYENLHQLEDLAGEAETKPLYMKAVMAIRKAQAGKPMGHLVGMDACCSGIQIMSAITGCIAGATATGLVDPNVRADAYTKTTDVMTFLMSEYEVDNITSAMIYEQHFIDLCTKLKETGNLSVSRKQAKNALMTLKEGVTI